MRVCFELTQDEGQAVFDLLKAFKVESNKTVVVGTPNENDTKTNEKEEAKTEEPDSNDWKPTDSPISLEEIRAVLKAKRLAGKGPEVAALVKSYGVNALPDISPDNYPDMMKKAELI